MPMNSHMSAGVGGQEEDSPGSGPIHDRNHGGHRDDTQHDEVTSDFEHTRDAILIEKYGHLYDTHYYTIPVFSKLVHNLMPHHHHHAIIKTNVETPDFDRLTAGQKLDRSLYALWKIRQVNHHFFSPDEEETIDSRPMRIARFTFRYAMYTFATGYFAFNLMNSRMTPLRLLKTAGIILGTKAALFGAEVFYDKVKMPGRRSLAAKYARLYGEKTLFEISKPSFPIEKLAHMHNKFHY